MTYDIMFLLHADQHDQGMLEHVSDGFMDYLLNSGHDALVSFNAADDQIGIELVGFTGDDEPDALRIAMELLTSAAMNVGVRIIWDDPPPAWRGFGSKDSPSATFKKLRTSIHG